MLDCGKISLCGLFYFGSVLKVDDLDGSLFLVDATSKAGNFRGLVSGHRAAFLLWIRDKA